MTSGELAGATVVFDLDGTLVDTAPDLVRALNATMDLEGLPPVRLAPREELAAAARGVEDALAALAALGAKLAVCTNKRTGLSEQLLDALNLSARFSAIVGADSVPQRKPHPDHYRAAVSRAGGVVRRSVMIGDSTADVASARAAGAPAAIVSFGYCDGDCYALGADVVLHRFADVAPACRRLLAARP